MAIAKIVGLETEYGIHVTDPEGDPTNGSSQLINAYVQDIAGRVDWDFDDEHPGQDARGFREASGVPVIETHLVNTVLTNGARYYVDHAHPEYSTPECSTVLELLAADRAGELILQRSMDAVRRYLNSDEQIIIYKNNSDGKGNSYGCHENYLVARSLDFKDLAAQFTIHLVTRQVFTGAGKIGCEEPDSQRRGFEITQRADFFEERIGLETTMNRPIINTRDEPHAEADEYRRLHVITGDANLSEVATLLKVGTSALLLMMIEDGVLAGGDLYLRDPVRAMHDVSHDLSLRTPLELESGRSASAIELQYDLFERAQTYARQRGLEALGPPEVGELVLSRWEHVLDGLSRDPASLRQELDWVAKYEIMHAYCERHNCDFDDPRIAALDLQYHDLRSQRSLFARLGMEKLLAPEVIESAVINAPLTTRAYFRGECLKRFGRDVVSANWDSIVVDVGSDPLQRIPMMDPLRGTAAHVATLLDSCDSVQTLISRLNE
ncbi:MAG TPA: depupylase/deamidase Dop [Acidimicrobiales bacterium]|nr:depupylase/deamidase Dop [Acidimicrobiales bacterium]